MAEQLILIDPKDVDWRIDDHTRTVGLEGIAAARAALAASASRGQSGAGCDPAGAGQDRLGRCGRARNAA